MKQFDRNQFIDNINIKIKEKQTEDNESCSPLRVTQGGIDITPLFANPLTPKEKGVRYTKFYATLFEELAKVLTETQKKHLIPPLKRACKNPLTYDKGILSVYTLKLLKVDDKEDEWKCWNFNYLAPIMFNANLYKALIEFVLQRNDINLISKKNSSKCVELLLSEELKVLLKYTIKIFDDLFPDYWILNQRDNCLIQENLHLLEGRRENWAKFCEKFCIMLEELPKKPLKITYKIDELKELIKMQAYLPQATNNPLYLSKQSKDVFTEFCKKNNFTYSEGIFHSLINQARFVEKATE